MKGVTNDLLTDLTSWKNGPLGNAVVTKRRLMWKPRSFTVSGLCCNKVKVISNFQPLCPIQMFSLASLLTVPTATTSSFPLSDIPFLSLAVESKQCAIFRVSPVIQS